MKFDKSVLESDYFTSLDSLSLEKKSVLEESKQSIETLKEYVFDTYNIENVYLHESFLEKNRNKKLGLYLKMNKDDFEDFLSVKEEFLKENMDIYVSVENSDYYHLTFNSKILEGNEPHHYIIYD